MQSTIDKNPPLTIGTLAKATGVGVETIRFYQRQGLIREPQRPVGSIRRYGEEDAARVTFIKTAQKLGFSLQEVKVLLHLEETAQCLEARKIAKQKRDEVRQKLRHLQQMEAALSAAVTACQKNATTLACPVIEACHFPSAVTH